MNFLRKKVLRQIERTYEWLELAEEAYREGGIEDGEKKLSLASAELRLAWETSCLRRTVETNIQAIKVPARDFNFAAAMALFLVFALSLTLAIGPLVFNTARFLPPGQSLERSIAEGDSLFFDKKDSTRSNLEFEMLKMAREGLGPVETVDDGGFWPGIQLVGGQVKKIDYLYGQTQWAPLDKGGS